jgi:OmcA/MtrC family decaheme c-type cytochrome
MKANNQYNMKNFLMLLIFIVVGLMIGVTGVYGQHDANIAPEDCAGCHSDTGAQHQASYNELYQTGVIEATDLTFAYNTTTDQAKMTFKLEKNGVPFDCRQTYKFLAAESWFGIVYASWDAKLGGFPVSLDLVDGLGYFPSKTLPTKTYDYTNNTCTVITAPLDAADDAVASTIETSNGYIQLYGAAESTNHTTQAIAEAEAYPLTSKGKYAFSALKKFGTVEYVSKANVSACETCHMKPYMPAHILTTTPDASAPDFAAQGTEFLTCVACHQLGKGGTKTWGLLADDPAAYAAQKGKLTPAQIKQYAYKATLKNNTHMIHAKKANYPQSMANCATCHEGKLDKILTNANFRADTCKACHPVNAFGLDKSGKRTTGVTGLHKAPALRAIMSVEDHEDVDFNNLEATNCTSECHSEPDEFSQMHTGYDSIIYADAKGTKYSDVFKVTIDSASFAKNVLKIDFSATKKNSPAGVKAKAADIKPTLMVGLYGYNTKDFIVGPHVKDAKKVRLLEAEIKLPDAGHPRVTTVKAANGRWSVKADLTMWADKIANGSVKRVEIAVMPALEHATKTMVSHGKAVPTPLALDAASKTFDLAANAFVAPQATIIDVNKCNDCHDALATTFHSGSRGGNITACRLCHIPESGASHLEMQSRSLDSYVHAIHSSQPFDIGDVDTKDSVKKLHLDMGSEPFFPKFGITDCEACHNKGTYEVPDQSKSLPGKLSGADKVAGRDAMNSIPSYVTGPGSRTCGSCHRAMMINQGNAAQLKAFNEKMKRNGYLVEDGKGVYDATVETIMPAVE